MSDYLRISDLHAYYSESHILHGVDLNVARGELVTLLGRNGSGRTTTLKAILGLVGRRSGSITVNGVETINLPTHRIAHLGLGYCPEERGIYSSLSCEENLLLPPRVAAEGGMTVDEIYEMFPNLKERRNSQGTRLSGGEQRAGDRAGDGARDPQAEGAWLHHRAGRAEFPLRRAAGRSALRDGARTDRRDDPEGRT